MWLQQWLGGERATWEGSGGSERRVAEMCFGEQWWLSAFLPRGSCVTPQHSGVSEAHSGCGKVGLVVRLQPAGGQMVGMVGTRARSEAVLRQS